LTKWTLKKTDAIVYYAFRDDPAKDPVVPNRWRAYQTTTKDGLARFFTKQLTGKDASGGKASEVGVSGASQAPKTEKDQVTITHVPSAGGGGSAAGSTTLSGGYCDPHTLSGCDDREIMFVRKVRDWPADKMRAELTRLDAMAQTSMEAHLLLWVRARSDIVYGFLHPGSASPGAVSDAKQMLKYEQMLTTAAAIESRVMQVRHGCVCGCGCGCE
jgi:hypothetical protein